MMIKNPDSELKLLNVCWEESYICMEKRNVELWYRSIVCTGETLHHEYSSTLGALCALWKEHPSVGTNLITTYSL